VALAKTHAISLIGLNGTAIEVETDISSNLPSFQIVGLPDASLSEATARVRAACSNSGLPLPNRRITVNLSPAAIPKQGSGFDLAIAVCALKASGQLPNFEATVFIGELGLDGSVRPVRGVLPALLAARRQGFTRAMVPAANAKEASLVDGVEVFSASSLRHAANQLGADVDFEPVMVKEVTHQVIQSDQSKDISDVLGQQSTIQTLIAAAAGGHHLLLVGSPGVGKTMLAERLPGLLPDLEIERAIETTAIHSISSRQLVVGSELVMRPPFESPHHSASASALIGGGKNFPTPGLISLAHNGVLFLDEAPEFQQPALEALRQAIESGEVQIARSSGVARFPSRFQLVLAANPCPCGFAMSKNNSCRCPSGSKSRYLTRLSGPLLDRIDIRLQVFEPSAAQIAIDKQNSGRISTRTAREIVTRARARSAKRNQQFGFTLNAHASSTILRKHLIPNGNLVTQLDDAVKSGRLNLRGYDRCLRLALTLADIDDREVDQSHIARAMVLRGADQLLVA
jgi:magnesium chelatase family protein